MLPFFGCPLIISGKIILHDSKGRLLDNCVDLLFCKIFSLFKGGLQIGFETYGVMVKSILGHFFSERRKVN